MNSKANTYKKTTWEGQEKSRKHSKMACEQN